MRVQYLDTDGDAIDVSSENEWKEMLRYFEESGSPTIKLNVSEVKNAAYFKDGDCHVKRAYFTGKEKQKVDENVDMFKALIPEVIASFFPCGKILPHNVPEWLEAAFKVTSLPNHEVDLDIDTAILAHVMHRKGMALLEEQRYKEATEMFSNLTLIQPNNHINFYNLACCYSLLRQEGLAINSLRNAVELGYKDWAHMEKDVDLLNVMHLNEFADIINSLKNPEKKIIDEVSKPSDSRDLEISKDWTQIKEPELEEPEPQNDLSYDSEDFDDDLPALCGEEIPALPKENDEDDEEEEQDEDEESGECLSSEESEYEVSEESEEAEEEEEEEEIVEEKEEIENPLVLRWLGQIEDIVDMGFDDRERLAILLEENKGNTVAVIEFLLTNSNY